MTLLATLAAIAIAVGVIGVIASHGFIGILAGVLLASSGIWTLLHITKPKPNPTPPETKD